MTTNPPNLYIVNASDKGLSRTNNEDAVVGDPSIGLAIVADGMGGYKAGEVASQMAVLHITSALKSHMTQAADDFNISLAKKLLTEIVQQANQSILETANAQSQCEGMGTTLVMALFIEQSVIVAHIGDSRAYLLRDNILTQLSHDHTMVQEQLDAGLLTEAQAAQSPYKNYITRALGTSPEVELELHVYDTNSDDIFLLCSDGLYEMLQYEEIASIILSHKDDLETASQLLIDKANQHGGKDNISASLIQIKPN